MTPKSEVGIISSLVLESILNICFFHGIWFQEGGASISSSSLEVSDCKETYIKPSDHQARVRNPTMRHQQGEDTASDFFHARKVTRVCLAAPTI